MKKLQPLKMAILGFGLFGESSLYPAFQKSSFASLSGITKTNPEVAKSKAAELNIPIGVAYKDRQELLENNEIEAIFIATPNQFHCVNAIECLKAGKHVILEKPMAMNVQECEKILNTVKETGKTLMIAHCLRFNSTLNHVHDLIVKNTFGSLVSISADFYSNGLASKRPWKYDWTLAGGGAAFDLGVHMVDSIRYLNPSPIKQVARAVLPYPKQPTEVDEMATFLLTFENNVLGKATSAYRGTRNTFLEVFGERGYLRAYDWQPNDVDVKIETFIDGATNSYLVHNEDMYVGELEAFTKTIRKIIANPVPGLEGLENQKIIDLANQ